MHAKIAYDELLTVPGLRPVMPQGAMYMMVSLKIFFLYIGLYIFLMKQFEY